MGFSLELTSEQFWAGFGTVQFWIVAGGDSGGDTTKTKVYLGRIVFWGEI